MGSYCLQIKNYTRMRRESQDIIPCEKFTPTYIMHYQMKMRNGISMTLRAMVSPYCDVIQSNFVCRAGVDIHLHWGHILVCYYAVLMLLMLHRNIEQHSSNFTYFCRNGHSYIVIFYQKTWKTCKIATSFFSCASCLVGKRSLSITLMATSPSSLRRRPARTAYTLLYILGNLYSCIFAHWYNLQWSWPVHGFTSTAGLGCAFPCSKARMLPSLQ